jgi:hypothetical protein
MRCDEADLFVLLPGEWSDSVAVCATVFREAPDPGHQVKQEALWENAFSVILFIQNKTKKKNTLLSLLQSC